MGSKRKKSSETSWRAKEYWDVNNWLWEGLDPDDELLIAYNRRPSEDMTSMCALCYKWFRSSDEFHAHMMTHIGTARFHECSICQKRFLARFLRIRHESTHKYDSNHPFTAYWGAENCEFPGDKLVVNHPLKRFKPVPYSPHYLKYIKKLEKKCRSEPISCIVCQMVFKEHEELQAHYDMTHAVHKCVHCLEIIENFSLYLTHLKTKHNIETPTNCRGGRWKVLETMQKLKADPSFPKPRELNPVPLYSYVKVKLDNPVKQIPEPEETVVKIEGTSIDEDMQVDIVCAHSDDDNKPDESLPETTDANAEKELRTGETGLAIPELVDPPLSVIPEEGNENEKEAEMMEEDTAVTENLDSDNLVIMENGSDEHSSEEDTGENVPVLSGDDKKDTFPCNVCGRLFSDERLRNRHSRLHNIPGDKPFECKYCRKPFATHSNRKEHERIHTGERPYKCPICERRFIQISNLKKHLQTHKDRNIYKCTVCDKQFVKESSLVLHQRSHATERRFRCQVCDRAYNYASLLKRHMRIHTGECPYQCPECHLPFHELVSLHYHRKKMHTGERPHKCEICGRGFILSSDLKKHRRVHSKDFEGAQNDAAVETNGGASSSSTIRETKTENEIVAHELNEADEDELLNHLNPEITLIVQPDDRNGETGGDDDDDDNRSVHYEIQNLNPNDDSTDGLDCVTYEAIEVNVDGNDELQIVSIKDVSEFDDPENYPSDSDRLFEDAASYLEEELQIKE